MKGTAMLPVVCDRCDREEYFELCPAPSMACFLWYDLSVDDQMEAAGWLVQDHGEERHLCPECAP